MKNKKIIILTIFILLIGIIGATFALWSWESSNSTMVTFTVKPNFTCSADIGGNISGSVAPADCTDTEYAYQRVINTSVNAEDGIVVDMNLWLNIDEISDNLSASNNFKYAITKDANSCTNALVSSGTFTGRKKGDKIDLINNALGYSSLEDTYYLYIWLDELEDNPNTMNQSFSFSIDGNCTQNEGDVLLSDIIKLKVDLTKTVDFKYTSEGRTTTNGEVTESQVTNGVYLFDGSDGTGNEPIYYYRGAVTDNNVLFNNICWKIVRTTGTGGIKMIYNGTAENGQCTKTTNGTTIGNSIFNPSAKNSKYVKYIYETTNENEETVMTDSTIKSFIDSWYSNASKGNMTGVTSKLEDTVWCSDTTTGGTISITFSSWVRTENKSKPQLICNKEADRYTTKNASFGNKLLDYPVALLTTDEIRMAGGNSIENTTYYLRNNGYWWLLSPANYFGNGARVVITYPNGHIEPTGSFFGTWTVSNPSNGQGVRPAISLKPNTTYASGNGTQEHPFQIK